MTVAELRDKYLRFFESKEHLRFPSGSLVPYDVTGKLDESLLFNGAGMIQFKPYFYGSAQPEHPRLTTAQKCVRTGDIDEVGDLSHLTFFEMMGNFSFGDYFIAQAIAFSWEFITDAEWLALDPSRVVFTVFETDDEAYNEWSKWLLGAGLNPEDHIFRLDEETNFWPAGAYTNGPPGPCGPNSEMFYWVDPSEKRSSPYTKDDFLRDDAAGKWLEFWNDVFIQYDWRGHHKTPGKPADGYVKDEIASLPFQSVDTGMGLERTATVLGGYKSIYDTDAFQPILAAIGELAGCTYGEEEAKDRAMRIVADHLRTSCFCLADGVLPGNSGRKYVLRRLIRRAVLKGFRTLGLERPFMAALVPTIVDMLGGFWTELAERQDTIERFLAREEKGFRKTLDRGMLLLLDELAKTGNQRALTSSLVHLPVGGVLSGEVAFRLYDTFGFPLEVTQEICLEHGVAVDVSGYEAAMLEAQQRSRAGQEPKVVYAEAALVGRARVVAAAFALEPATKFLGYEKTKSRAKAVWQQLGEGGTVDSAFGQTPFYAAAGGQVSDIGIVRVGALSADVIRVAKQGAVVVHTLKPANSDPEATIAALRRREADLLVDVPRRRATERNHTATHLLHAALRRRLGPHITQAGSYVGPDRLRFDFTHGEAMSREELAETERIVNGEILRNTKVRTYVDLPIEEAKSMGAMALFGEKYGNKVRMVEVGDFSRELCGGTHVRALGEIGLFKIVSESSAASGVRRIEAITGQAAYGWTVEEETRLREASALLKSTPKDLVHAIERALESQRDLRQKLEKARSAGASGSQAAVTDLGAVELATELLTEGEQADATRLADQLADGHPRRVVVVALVGGGKVLFVSKAGADAQKAGAHAGNLVRELAKLTGGGGGGGPAFATAGGRHVDLVNDAIVAAVHLVKAMLG